MKLIEVARANLRRREYECWYSRRIEMLEPEEVARRMNISVARVHNYVWEAERALVDHAADIEDPNDYLCTMLSIIRSRRIENVEDSTPKAAIRRQERQNFAKNS